MNIPYHKPCLDEAAIGEVVDTLKSGWLTTGPKTRRFEEEFAAYQGVKRAVGVTSCTAALHLCLAALDLGPEDEVITTPITFAATGNVIETVGARAVFADIDPETWLLDPDKLREAIGPRTKAIVPVHYAGQPCEIDRIEAIAHEAGLPVIYDCAHAIESRYRGRTAAGFGMASCYSFYANKNMTTGEGGMICLNDGALADRLQSMRNHGLSRSAFDRSEGSRYQAYETAERGFKYNMFDIQAALGIHQLPRVEEWLEKRNRTAKAYDRAFSGHPACRLLTLRPEVRGARHLYPMLVEDRPGFIEEMGKRGVGLGVHFTALHLHRRYRERFGFRPGDFPVAEFVGARVVSLPLFPLLTEAEVSYIIESALDALNAGPPLDGQG